MHFRKIRLSGFKSFVEPAEILIEPGTTGIVGPNGCGKSNVVEALRWAMGESSAKQMRGDEMDDVIFAGTAARPSRNVAEVALSLDNSARNAPAMFNDREEVDVVRRIDRGRGSSYRVNGREVRARDVQLMFADASTGARSTAIVSQGQIGAFIAARPQQRRAVLEEAAGIAGLHSRRHEAELRLKAAEANLERLDDVLRTLDAQHQSLKKQARQASRYRRLSELIRNAEAELLHARWLEAEARLDAAMAAYRAAEDAVTESARRSATAAKEQSLAAAALPEARKHEAEAAAALQRQVVERDRLEAEARRIEEERAAAGRRLAQLEDDHARELRRQGDAAAALSRIEEELAGLVDAPDESGFDRAAAEARIAELDELTAALDQQVSSETARRAAAEAERAAAARRLAEAEDRAGRADRQLAQIRADREAATARAIPAEAVAAAEHEARSAEAEAASAAGAVEAAERAVAAAERAEREARGQLQEWRNALLKLQTEVKTLRDLLASEEADLWPPVLDSLQVEAGYEAALGAALGDDLNAALSDSAPIHWGEPSPAELPPLPAGAEPLARFVTAPGVMVARLAQIGVVESSAAGGVLRAHLRPGQRLVSIEGALWRWDGYTVAGGAASPAARRLEQRNRLETIEKDVRLARSGVEDAERVLARRREAVGAAESERRAARDAVKAADRALTEARERRAALTQEAAVQESRLQALAETERRLAEELAAAEAARDEARAAAAAGDHDGDGEGALEEARRSLADARERLTAERSALDRHDREVEARRQRRVRLDGDAESWRGRIAEAHQHIARMDERIAEERAALAALDERPDALHADIARMVELIEAAEAKRRHAGDRLAEAESLSGAKERALRTAEAEAATAREERARADGGRAQARQALDSVAERIAERLSLTADGLPAITGFGPESPPPATDSLAQRLERLQRERDGMGAVNLRAEQEMTELEEQVGTIRTEREDLIAAIAKLRRGIGELNREGRERLLAAFRDVDRHFRTLFVELFGGGEAHLTLVESDDPLEAGLEIMASPPGKKLQSLGLLSGGERALTALALLFAVFLTNPAPICVLDEVDAPLDDSNVDRFCNAVEAIAARTETRFLIVTHHRLTMARMDRLYGVTMAERGVSQLVSVDLRQAEALRATA